MSDWLSKADSACLSVQDWTGCLPFDANCARLETGLASAMLAAQEISHSILRCQHEYILLFISYSLGSKVLKISYEVIIQVERS